jgi:hypothetical protein
MGSQSAFAKAAGVDRATVCRILRGRAPLRPKILRALNVRMVFVSVSKTVPARKHPVSRSPNRSSKGRRARLSERLGQGRNHNVS